MTRASTPSSLVLILAALLVPSILQARQAPPIVAVFLMESRGSPLSGDELVGLTDYMATKLGEQGQFQIIPRDEIKKRLAEQKQRSYKDCVDQSCQIDIGRELAAQYTVTSSISKVGRKCLLTAQLYDLRKAATVMTASSKKTCDPDELITGVEDIVSQFQEKMSLLEKTRAKEVAKVTPPKPEPKSEPKPEPKPEPVKTPKDWRPADAQPPAPKPEPKPYVSTSTVEPASKGWAMGASVTGFISAALVLGLAVGADMAEQDGGDCYWDEWANDYVCDDSDESLILGGVATVALGVMGPVVAAGARSPRGDGVHGSTALKIVGWIAYGVGMAEAAALLVIGVADMDVELPPGVITSVGVLGAVSLTMFSIDGLIARSQASRAMSAELVQPPTEGLVWAPAVSPVRSVDGRGVDGASFGLTGRF